MATVATENRWMGSLLTVQAKLAVDKQQTNEPVGPREDLDFPELCFFSS